MIDMLAPTETIFIANGHAVISFRHGRLVKSSRASFNARGEVAVAAATTVVVIVVIIVSWRDIICL